MGPAELKIPRDLGSQRFDLMTVFPIGISTTQPHISTSINHLWSHHTATALTRIPKVDPPPAPRPPANDIPRRDVDESEVQSTLKKIRCTPLGKASDALARKIFHGMVRDSGTTYEQHANIVAEGGVRLALRDNESFDECLQQYVVGKFHDGEEDVPGSIKTIRKELCPLGLQEDAIHDILRLTKLDGEPYFDRVDQILPSRRAIRAKKPDSEHNSSEFEQRHLHAKGEFKSGEIRYAIAGSLYDAVLEGRIDPALGVKGYLKTLGQDVMNTDNRHVFEKGFKRPDDILQIIDSNAPLVKEIKIPVLNWDALAAKTKRAFQRVMHPLMPKLVDAAETLPPMDESKTLNKTTQLHPQRRSI